LREWKPNKAGKNDDDDADLLHHDDDSPFHHQKSHLKREKNHIEKNPEGPDLGPHANALPGLKKG